MAFKLIIRSEGGDPREIDLPEAGVTFGRHASNTEKLEGVEVSRFHARFDVRGEHVLVTDRESYSGTWIDGALLDGSFELGHGDRVDIGDHQIFIVDVAKAFTVPKYVPPRDDDDEEPDDGGDDFFEKKPGPGGLRVISSTPPVAKPKPVEPPSTEAVPSAETKDAAETAPASGRDVDEKSETGEGASAAPPSETESSSAPIPAFKMSVTSEALAAALERAGRSVSREHHRIVFVAPDPPRDPIGMRNAPITFGTDAECTVRVEGEGIRATHATLAVEGGVVVIRASDGATLRVNGADTERCVLTPGDRVEIGNVAFVAAGRAREHYTAASRTTGWVSQVPVFAVPAPTASNARAWFFAVLILAAGVGGMLFLLLGREPPVHVPPETPRTVPTDAFDAGAAVDAGPRDVLLAMSPAEIETRLDEARSDVEAFETESALARLAVFHGRTDLPSAMRIRAAMLEVTAYVADNRPEDAARSCASAIDIAGGDVTFLADESPRVRSLCGVVGTADDSGASARDASEPRRLGGD